MSDFILESCFGTWLAVGLGFLAHSHLSLAHLVIAYRVGFARYPLAGAVFRAGSFIVVLRHLWRPSRAASGHVPCLQVLGAMLCASVLCWIRFFSKCSILAASHLLQIETTSPLFLKSFLKLLLSPNLLHQ